MTTIQIRDDIAPEDAFDQETGDVSTMVVAVAIQVWGHLNDRTMTLGECAMTFNISLEEAARCVEAHPWMFVHGDRANLAACTIEHEGE